jgi:putative ABC transport system substrate-binding protein
MSYGADIDSARRFTSTKSSRVPNPPDLPVVRPTKFVMVINLKAAKALGLHVPDKLLALADEVIE